MYIAVSYMYIFMIKIYPQSTYTTLALPTNSYHSDYIPSLAKILEKNPSYGVMVYQLRWEWLYGHQIKQLPQPVETPYL